MPPRAHLSRVARLKGDLYDRPTMNTRAISSRISWAQYDSLSASSGEWKGGGGAQVLRVGAIAPKAASEHLIRGRRQMAFDLS
jgi:hypothetical protein